MDAVCEAFTCTPDVAERQDLRTVMAVLDARALRRAAAQHNEDATKLTEGQAGLLMEMVEAVNS